MASRIDKQIVAREERKYRNEVREWYAQKDEEVKMEGRPEWIYHQRLKHGREECKFIEHNPNGGVTVQWTKGWLYFWEADYDHTNVPYDKLESISSWGNTPERHRDISESYPSRPEKLTWDKLRGA